MAALKRELSSFAVMDSTEALRQLGSAPEGLSQLEACSRAVSFGPNTVAHEKNIHVILQFLANFKNPLVLVLLCVAAVSFVMGDIVEGLIVAAMVALSVTLNFFQEYKAGEAAKKLRARVASKAIVVRGGEAGEIKVSDIVPGDVVQLNAGDLIPADCRMVDAKDFFVNQSALTGESFPVEKQHTPIAKGRLGMADLINVVFYGTSVVTGSGLAVVVNTGGNTEFGAVAENIENAPEENEFTVGIGRFSYMLLRVIIFFVIFVFFFNALIKQNVFESFLFAIAVAVGLTPEFLPMIMSVTMGKGSVNMAKKGVIVKRLTAIPTFGSMDVLCTDKTGTLTQDKISLITYTDVFGKESEHVLLYAYLSSYFQTGITNPLNEAVLRFRTFAVETYKKIDEIPFDFERKKMSVVVLSKRKALMITKGAPEEVMRSSHYYREGGRQKKITPHIASRFSKAYQDLSKQGFRVLAIATKEVSNATHTFSKHDEKGMTIAGFAAFLDPVKPGVRTAIDELEAMGIEMKVITGDNELVAAKICEDAGIEVRGILLGHDIHHMTDRALRHTVEKTTLFARFSPIEKSRIIQALKENNHVVGYMGDGINDAPSLSNADVGISVNNAVDVARESADIILTHKSLHELRDGVVEGRKTFGNTMKYIMMGISSNFGNMFSVLGAVLFLPFLPMLPIQILLNNFLYDFSQITIPSDAVDDEFVQKPKRWNMKFIRNFMFTFGPISSLFDFVTFFVLYWFFKSEPSVFQTGWFMESLATQTLVIHVIRTNKLPFIGSRPSIYLTITTLLAVTIGWLIPFSPIGPWFGFTRLPFSMMATLFFIVVGYLLLTEFGKRVFYRKYYFSTT